MLALPMTVEQAQSPDGVRALRPLQSANAVRAQPTNEPSEERQNKKGITE